MAKRAPRIKPISPAARKAANSAVFNKSGAKPISPKDFGRGRTKSGGGQRRDGKGRFA